MATKTMKIGLSTSDKSTMSATIQAAVLSIVAPTYSSSSLYAVGDLVYYNGGLYKCNTAITTAEAWTAAHWTATTFADEEKGKLSRGDHDGTTSVGHSDSAKSLDTQVGNDDQTPFSANTVGISSDVETGYQELRKLVGVDVVDNQLVRNPVFSNSDYWVAAANEYGTLSISSGVATWTCTALPDYYYRTGFLDNSNYLSIPYDHKVLAIAMVKSSVQANVSIYGLINNEHNYFAKQAVNANTWTLIMGFISDRTSGKTITRAKVCYSSDSTSDVAVGTTLQCSEVFLIDLTQRYGSNEVVNAIIGTVGQDDPADIQVQRLLKFDPNILKLTSYDAGSFPTVKAAKLETVDYNQWDEETELGYYDVSNGGYVYRSDGLCSKRGHNIRIAVGQNVYAYLGDNNSASIVAIFFDANGNYLGYDTRRNANFTIPFGAYSMAFYLNSYGTTYNHDISIFLYWDGSRIGYEPYQKHEVALPNERLHGILKVVNGKVVADGDERYPDGEGDVQRYYKYTFTGNETFVQSTLGRVVFYMNTNSLPEAKYSANRSEKGNIICNTFNAIDDNHVEAASKQVSVCGDTGSYLCFCLEASESVGDVNALKTYLQNNPTTIVYELATETETDSDAYADTFYGDDFGNMRFLDENGNEIPGLLGCEIFYKANIAGFAESLYVKTDGKPNDVVVQSELTAEATTRQTTDNALQAALGGTLRQVLCVKESLDFENTGYVDLGSLSGWFFHSNGAYWTTRAMSAQVKAPSSDAGVAKVISTFAKTSSADDVYLGNNGVGISSDGTIFYKDDNTSSTVEPTGLLAYEKASE